MKKEKRYPHQIATRVARAVWPEKQGMQRVGILILGLFALIGVTQASNVQKLLFGSAGSVARTQTLAATTSAPATSAAITSTASETEPTEVGSTAPNIVDLVGDSELIIRGAVSEVTDGFENGVPYTEVKVQVDETIRGQVGDEYTFRQFGLKEPRRMDNGKIYLGVTPAGWSKYTSGENVVLFLYKPAQMTGLRTTTGLGQGKVVLGGGNAVSQAGNEGLFENVTVSPNLLNDRDKRLLATKRGAVNAEGFLSFVRRAVKDKWIEGGKMRHAKK